MNKGIVTLVSGGIDSTLVCVMAKEEGIPVFPLFIDYGQLGVEREWEACSRLLATNGLPEPVRMDLGGFGKVVPSGLTCNTLRVNEDAFLPGRNLLFVLMGSAYAVHIGVSKVAIGLLDPAHRLFPDQSEEFLVESERIMNLAMGTAVTIVAPLFSMSKAEVMELASARGINGTYSCHAGGAEPCGICIACIEIERAQERN